MPHTNSSEMPPLAQEPKRATHLSASAAETVTVSVTIVRYPSAMIDQETKELHYIFAAATSTVTTSNPITIIPLDTDTHCQTHTSDSLSVETSSSPLKLPY